MFIRLVAAALAVCLVVVAPTRADTIHVPGEAATIQGGIDLAQPGDTVLVGPGLYVENVVLAGTYLTLRGEQGADVTTLLAPGGTALRVLDPVGGEPVIEGFTITGGTGTAIPAPLGFPPGTIVAGGGVLVENSSPFGSPAVRLHDCVLRDNSAPDAGGGLFAVSSVVLERCLVERNTSFGRGGGLFIAVAGTPCGVLDTVIHENIAVEDGGGYWTTDLTSLDGSLVTDNLAFGDGGGGYADVGANWIGIFGATFVGNRAVGSGGGLAVCREIGISCCASGGGDLVLIGNEAGGDGGGLHLSSRIGGPSLFQVNRIELERVVAADNIAGGSGGGAWIEVDGDGGGAWVRGATLVGNVAGVGADAVTMLATNRDLINAIVWDHAVPFDASPPDLAHVNIEGGWPGFAVSIADPLFIDAAAGDYRLRGGSPCIDTGDPLADLDLDGSQADRGALPFEGWVDLGQGLAGTLGEPALDIEGQNKGGATTTLSLTNAASSAGFALVIGFGELGLPFKGGVLVPSPDQVLLGLSTDASGTFVEQGIWSPLLPSDSKSWFQVWVADATGPAGWTASNALLATTR